MITRERTVRHRSDETVVGLLGRSSTMGLCSLPDTSRQLVAG
jgi:hypothetical protein